MVVHGGAASQRPVVPALLVASHIQSGDVAQLQQGQGHGLPAVLSSLGIDARMNDDVTDEFFPTIHA